MLSIKYNNLDSYKDLGLIIENTPAIPSVNANYNEIVIPGKEGSLNIFTGYSDNKISIDFGIKTQGGFYINKSKIISWLNSKISSELVFSNNKSIFLKVKKTSVGDISTTGKSIRRFSAIFTVEPFVYLREGTETLEITIPTTIYNERANYDSYPILKIYGSGTGSMIINGSTIFTLTNIDEYIVIDSTIELAYKENINKGRNMTGDFPVFFVGENNISWSGDITKIEVTPNWRCY